MPHGSAWSPVDEEHINTKLRLCGTDQTTDAFVRRDRLRLCTVGWKLPRRDEYHVRFAESLLRSDVTRAASAAADSLDGVKHAAYGN